MKLRPWLVRFVHSPIAKALAALAVTWFAYRRSAKLVTALSDPRVQQAQDALKQLQDERTTIVQAAVVDDRAITRVDVKLEENKRELSSALTQHGLTSEEISNEFTKLGF